MEERLGDTYILVNPLKLYLKTTNAELITQFASRRTDFTKPTGGYGLVDIFGKSILTQDGQEWRRHKKIVGPSFSEKSNRLVFEESLRQTEGMVNLWATQGKNTKVELRVVNTAEDAATLSLHVICAAGGEFAGEGIAGFQQIQADRRSHLVVQGCVGLVAEAPSVVRAF
jgi:cytochrome P450